MADLADTAESSPMTSRNLGGRPKRPAHLPPYPKGLPVAERALWDTFVGSYQFSADDTAGLELLHQALLAHSRARSAATIVEREGEVIRDRFGGCKAHPAVAVELQARRLYTDLLRRLGLDLEPLRPGPGRPTGGRPGMPIRRS